MYLSSVSDQPRRPVFFWLVLLVCVVYAAFFAFTIYAGARYYGVEKLLAGAFDRTTRGGSFQRSMPTALRLALSGVVTGCWRSMATRVPPSSASPYSSTCAATRRIASTPIVRASAYRSTCCYPLPAAGISRPSSKSAAWCSSSANVRLTWNHEVLLRSITSARE